MKALLFEKTRSNKVLFEKRIIEEPIIEEPNIEESNEEQWSKKFEDGSDFYLN